MLAVPLLFGMALGGVRSAAAWLVPPASVLAFLAHYALVPVLQRARERKAMPPDWRRRRLSWGPAYLAGAGGFFSAVVALAPADAPQAVKDVIAAGNRIALTPYRYGGGHASFSDAGYDCSGSVSYALHGGGLLARPLPSSGFYGFGSAGGGRWITVYANGGHMYMVVAGLRFDTSSHGAGDSRWTDAQRSSAGYRVRHPDGL